jgi:kumamolisin
MHPIKSVQFVGQTKIHWLLLMLLCLASCSFTVNTPKPTPTPPAFSPVKLGIPADALNSPVEGPLDPNTQMKVNVYFKLNQSQQNELRKVTTNQQDLKQEANKIGITDAQYEQIKHYLQVQNVTLHLNTLHTSVELDGTAQAMSNVFRTTLVNHKYQDHTFYAPKTDPLLPTQVASWVVSITGLDNFTPPMDTGFTTQEWHPHKLAKAQADCTALNRQDVVEPQKIAQAYGYDKFFNEGYKGKGLTINLIEIDGYPEADVANYGACVGYNGQITVKTIGPAPSRPGEETALDIEMIEALAPEANIVDYQTGDSRYLTHELQQLIDDNTNNAGYGNIVSMSLGGAENQEPLNYLNTLDQELSVLTNSEHMTVFVASGDCGAFTDRHYGSYSVSFPASDPNVVGVGGTMWKTDGNGNRTDETVWAQNNPNRLQCKNSWGTGGGNSESFTQPSWQTGIGVQNSNSHGNRQIPDVAAIAFNLPIYFDGQWVRSGGTSAAAPIWASGMLLVNQKTIDKYSVFFAGPSLFYGIANSTGQVSPYLDITAGGGGSTATFPSTSGWDFATGLGTPNLVDFYQVLAAAAQQQK